LNHKYYSLKELPLSGLQTPSRKVDQLRQTQGIERNSASNSFQLQYEVGGRE
jgi:hypothetical protein